MYMNSMCTYIYIYIYTHSIYIYVSLLFIIICIIIIIIVIIIISSSSSSIIFIMLFVCLIIPSPFLRGKRALLLRSPYFDGWDLRGATSYRCLRNKADLRMKK